MADIISIRNGMYRNSDSVRAVETKTGDVRASETDKYHRLEYMANGRVDWHHTIL